LLEPEKSPTLLNKSCKEKCLLELAEREKTNNNRYLLSVAVSKRVNQLLNGDSPKIDKDLSRAKPVDIALEEIAKGLIKIDVEQ
jgi:DNA-directed RNA polymerase subunit omega